MPVQYNQRSPVSNCSKKVMRSKWMGDPTNKGNPCVTYIDVLWRALACFGVNWRALACTGVLWRALACSGVH